MRPSRLRPLPHRLPGVGPLEDRSWRRRHRVLVLLLAAHAPLLALAAVVAGLPLGHAAVDVLPVVLALGLARARRLSRSLREAAVAVGLVAAAAALVHLTGGLGEAHFHYFVVLALLPLYQTWPPLAIAVGLVVVQHGLLGALAPERVFDDARAADPWPWALLHGAGVLAAAAASALVVSVGERERGELTGERDAARAAREEALRALADRDPLTGVPNRRVLDQRLADALATEGAGVLLLDLDGFKGVNDQHGHGHGDVVLQRCARALTDALRPGDLLARVGGDEFVVVCPGMLDVPALSALGDRLATAVHDAVAGDGVGISAGVAVALPGESAADVLARADRAMYAAKRGRRRRVELPVPRLDPAPPAPTAPGRARSA